MMRYPAHSVDVGNYYKVSHIIRPFANELDSVEYPQDGGFVVAALDQLQLVAAANVLALHLPADKGFIDFHGLVGRPQLLHRAILHCLAEAVSPTQQRWAEIFVPST